MTLVRENVPGPDLLRDGYLEPVSGEIPKSSPGDSQATPAAPLLVGADSASHKLLFC